MVLGEEMAEVWEAVVVALVEWARASHTHTGVPCGFEGDSRLNLEYSPSFPSNKGHRNSDFQQSGYLSRL